MGFEWDLIGFYWFLMDFNVFFGFCCPITLAIARFFSPTRQVGLFVARGKPLKWHHGCQI